MTESLLKAVNKALDGNFIKILQMDWVERNRGDKKADNTLGWKVLCPFVSHRRGIGGSPPLSPLTLDCRENIFLSPTFSLSISHLLCPSPFFSQPSHFPSSSPSLLL